MMTGAERQMKKLLKEYEKKDWENHHSDMAGMIENTKQNFPSNEYEKIKFA